MQTHLHTPRSLTYNARFLHPRQLAAQVNETDQVLTSIECNLSNWIARHPITQAWRDHYAALVLYGVYVYREWRRRYRDGERGGKLSHKSGERILDRWAAIGCPVRVRWPEWYGDERMTQSHRKRLLAKKPGWYGQLGWNVTGEMVRAWYPEGE